MKTKKIIIVLAFALLMLGLKAQTKYEYASVLYNIPTPKKAVIKVSTGDNYTETQLSIPQNNFENLTPIMAFINKMGDEGWEVYAVNTQIATGVCYSLRRKK